jgi:predicted nucleic acid-binding Zn ribbon protein
MADPPLAECPSCQGPVRRVLQPVAVVHATANLLSRDNLKKHGFKKLVRSGNGKYREDA